MGTKENQEFIIKMECLKCGKRIEIMLNGLFRICPKCDYFNCAITESEFRQAKNYLKKAKKIKNL